ncbi:MAG: hypothetical protein WB445_11195 [Acinetobacter sp.]
MFQNQVLMQSLAEMQQYQSIKKLTGFFFLNSRIYLIRGSVIRNLSKNKSTAFIQSARRSSKNKALLCLQCKAKRWPLKWTVFATTLFKCRK